MRWEAADTPAPWPWLAPDDGQLLAEYVRGHDATDYLDAVRRRDVREAVRAQGLTRVYRANRRIRGRLAALAAAS